MLPHSQRYALLLEMTSYIPKIHWEMLWRKTSISWGFKTSIEKQPDGIYSEETNGMEKPYLLALGMPNISPPCSLYTCLKYSSSDHCANTLDLMMFTLKALLLMMWREWRLCVLFSTLVNLHVLRAIFLYSFFIITEHELQM